MIHICADLPQLVINVQRDVAVQDGQLDEGQVSRLGFCASLLCLYFIENILMVIIVSVHLSVMIASLLTPKGGIYPLS